MIIKSRQNSRVKDLAALQRKQTRRETGLTIVEGCRMVNEAFLYANPRTLILSERIIGTDAGEELRDLARERSIEILEMDEGCYRKISALKNPEGAATVLTSQETSLGDIMTEDSRLLVTAGIQNPGNAGAIVRVSEAAGASGCIFLDGVDLTHPGFLRAAAGSAFRFPCASAERTTFLAAVKSSTIRILAAANTEDGIPYTEAVYSPPTAICIGAEGEGLPEDIIQAVDSLIFIPMREPVESLNAAVAAGIILYQANFNQ